MIDYFKGIYGLNLLSRVHGSALYKGSLVGLLSSLIHVGIVLRWNERRGPWWERDDDDDLDHPYGVGVLVSSVTFLIIFRANYGYQRYWEACDALHHFMSKWMDATVTAAVFHMQNEHFDGARPPNFFDHDELNKLNLTRARTRHGQKKDGLAADDDDDGDRRLKSVYDCEKEITGTFVVRSNYARDKNDDESTDDGDRRRRKGLLASRPPSPRKFAPPSPRRKSNALPGSGPRDGRWDIIPPSPDTASSAMLRRTALNSKHFPSAQLPNRNFAYRPGGRTPPLFLQELAHLSSLACAVALSTLRNDMEDRESPLGVYVPGMPWPVSDPDQLPKHVRDEYQHGFHIVTIILHWLGRDRLPRRRSNYNAARPLPVLGGVSDAEIQFLQMARGPHAKVQLAMSWLGELITREHLQGGLGTVHAAIFSRLVQCLSDGMMLYHQARKIMYIPFPFPHAQLSAFFITSMAFAVPFLIDQYAKVPWIGSTITFLTVTCLAGLHEVGRELENPFRNVPNEIPLCTLHALYNEALVTVFSGYNPDSFWDPEMHRGSMGVSKEGRWRRDGDDDDELEGIWASSAGMPEMPIGDGSAAGKVLTKGVPPKKNEAAGSSSKAETNNDHVAKGRQGLNKGMSYLPRMVTLRNLVTLRRKQPSTKSESLLQSSPRSVT